MARRIQWIVSVCVWRPSCRSTLTKRPAFERRGWKRKRARAKASREVNDLFYPPSLSLHHPHRSVNSSPLTLVSCFPGVPTPTSTHRVPLRFSFLFFLSFLPSYPPSFFSLSFFLSRFLPPLSNILFFSRRRAAIGTRARNTRITRPLQRF